MKRIILLCLLLPVFACAQKIAVLDPQLKQSPTYVSKLSMSHLLQGKFVMHRDNISDVMETVRSFRAIIDGKDDIPASMSSVIRGTTYFTASGEKGNYSVVLDTKIDKMGSYFVLVDRKDSRKESLERIDNFLVYLEKAK